MVSVDGTSPQLVKVEAILKIPSPTDTTSLRSFLRLVNSYRRFIPHFSTIAKPLNTLLQKDQSYTWGHEQQTAFEQLQQALVSDPVLRPPNYALPFILQTDWGQPGIGLSCLNSLGRTMNMLLPKLAVAITRLSPTTPAMRANA